MSPAQAAHFGLSFHICPPPPARRMSVKGQQCLTRVCWTEDRALPQELQGAGGAPSPRTPKPPGELGITYVPCNSGSKGGCWAPYTCWMLVQKKGGAR